jgi:hypothetical protein
VEGSAFEEEGFFAALNRDGVRYLLIGRRALIALGLPLMTSDYDLWLHIDDCAKLNAAARPFDLVPTRKPDEARSFGRYVLENDEHVDVLISRTRTTVNGVVLSFDDAYARRQQVVLGNTHIEMPSIDDLILTKQFAARPRDAEDIRLLTQLKEKS